MLQFVTVHWFPANGNPGRQEALSLWEYVVHTHTLRDSLSAPEEEEPTEEETEILDAYERGDERHQPFISHTELKKELGLR